MEKVTFSTKELKFSREEPSRIGFFELLVAQNTTSLILFSPILALTSKLL